MSQAGVWTLWRILSASGLLGFGSLMTAFALGFTLHFGPFEVPENSWFVLLEWMFGVAIFFLVLYILTITVLAECLKDALAGGAIKPEHLVGAATNILMTAVVTWALIRITTRVPLWILSIPLFTSRVQATMNHPYYKGLNKFRLWRHQIPPPVNTTSRPF